MFMLSHDISHFQSSPGSSDKFRTTSQPTWAVSPPVGCYCLHSPPSSFIITQLLILPTTEGRMLNWPRHTRCKETCLKFLRIWWWWWWWWWYVSDTNLTVSSTNVECRVTACILLIEICTVEYQLFDLLNVAALARLHGTVHRPQLTTSLYICIQILPP